MPSPRSWFAFPVVLLVLAMAGGCDGSSTPAAGDWRTNVERYRAQGDYKAAAIEVKNALKKAPKDPELRLLLGELQGKEQDFGGAEKELKRALSLGAETGHEPGDKKE